MLLELFGPAYAPPAPLRRQRGYHVYRVRKISIAAIWSIAVIAIAGCEPPVEPQSEKRRLARETPAAAQQAASPATAAIGSPLPDQQQSTNNDGQLKAQLAMLESERAALEIERDQLTRQVEAHQADGAKKLAQLKAEWNAFEKKVGANTDPSARERFAERARVEMESALMMDQEYRAHLEATEGKLQATEEQMRSLLQDENPATASE